LGPAYGQNGSVGVAYPAAGIRIDGDLSDWPKDAPTYPIARVEYGEKLAGKDDLNARFRMAYIVAEHALYVAVEVNDDSVVLDGPGIARWDAQDGCEIYLNAAHAGSGSPVVQYARYGNQSQMVGPSGATDRAVKVAVARTEKKTIYEWRVELGAELVDDRVIGFDISVADKDEDGSFSWLAWGPGTNKVDTPDRCGEFVLVRPGMGLGEVSGTVAWRDASEAILPPRVRIQSTRSAPLWREAIVDPTGAYKATDLPLGSYSIHAVDSPDIRVDEKPHVAVEINAGSPAKAQLLRIVPIPWPGLIGDEGVLRSTGPVDAEALDRVLKAYLDYYKVPGMSIAVIKDSKVVYHRGLGVRNTLTREPVTDDTVFEAASMTKPVCAYLVLRLVDRGVLKLDTPLYTYLPYEDIAYDDRYKLITARMVLTHRSGFPNWRSGKLDIKFIPGTQFSYSGEGFVYLGKVVEKLTGKKLVQLCREEIFEPLGIEHASLVWNEQIAKLTATGHGGTAPMAKRMPSQPNMAASLHIDAKNYARFLIAYVRGKGLAEATAKDMLRSQGAIPDDPKSSFGLGVGIEQTPQGTHFGHGGRNPGFTSRSVMDKDLGIGYVFLVNNDDADKIENILNAYLIAGKSGLKSTKPIAHRLARIDPKIYDEYVGRYRINYETILTVTREGDKLMAQPSGEARVELFPESETVFFLKPTTDATATFVKDPNGRISHVVLRRDGRKTEAKRLEGGRKPGAATDGTPGTSSLFDTIRNLDMQLFGAFNARDVEPSTRFSPTTASSPTTRGA
jgi:CubicO group peptidase (beta-lactamase class C family)